jgi:hypothetical protein
MFLKLTEKLFFQNIRLEKNKHANLNIKVLMENNQRQTSKFINKLFQ